MSTIHCGIITDKHSHTDRFRLCYFTLLLFTAFDMKYLIKVYKKMKKLQSHLIALRLRSKASGGMWLPPILWILCGKQKLTSSQLLMCSRTTPVVQRLQKTDIPCLMNTYYSMRWHWTEKYNKMSNHTPVVGFLQVSSQLTFGKNLPKRGLRASVTFNEEQKISV